MFKNFIGYIDKKINVLSSFFTDINFNYKTCELFKYFIIENGDQNLLCRDFMKNVLLN